MTDPARRDHDDDRPILSEGGLPAGASSAGHAHPLALAAVTAPRSADDALVLEVVDDDGHIELVFGAARVPGLLRAPAWLVEGADHEVAVFVGDERIGVGVRVVAGCAVRAGEVARVAFVGLDVAGRALRPLAPPTPALEGALADVAFVDVIQLVCAARRDALIEVRQDAAGTGLVVDGVVGCSGGRVVYARCSDGTGAEDAFFALASAACGRFAVHYGRTAPRANVESDTTWLALEAMRRLDEQVGRPPSASMPPAAVAFDPFVSLLPMPAAAVEARDEEHTAEPLLTPPELRRGRASVPPSAVEPSPRVTAPVTPSPSAAPVPLAPSAAIPQASVVAQGAPCSPSGPPLPTRAVGRFARFFDEARGIDRTLCGGLAAEQGAASPDDELVDLADIEAIEDDITANLRFTSLRVGVAPAVDVGERDTEVVERHRALSA